MTARSLLAAAIALLTGCATAQERAAAREERRAVEREACLHAQNPPWLDEDALAEATQHDAWETRQERSRLEERARDEKDEKDRGPRRVVVVAPQTTQRDRILLEREDFWRRCALLREDERTAGRRAGP
jgi:hypothetical protein